MLVLLLSALMLLLLLMLMYLPGILLLGAYRVVRGSAVVGIGVTIVVGIVLTGSSVPAVCTSVVYPTLYDE